MTTIRSFCRAGLVQLQMLLAAKPRAKRSRA
jgi:hypothetical protein